jgi:hypothetical protein
MENKVMDVKAAIKNAKQWVADVLADEKVSNIGLEEVEFDEEEKEWRITIGFSRPWDVFSRNALTAITGQTGEKRDYRVLTVKEPNGEVISMKKREG